MPVEFASEVQFSCQTDNGKLIKIDNILKHSRFVSKYNDYVGNMASSQDVKFMNIFITGRIN
ncbi:MAG TPA: hypothetical protein ENO33_03695 [Hydrogenobaculum sp.]|nr:hypothetical protein [Hydrogenobaculum sp.]